jgi:DNA-binding HxlR family transcriptional regulator
MNSHNDVVLRAVSKKFVLPVMAALGEKTLSYVEVQRATDAKPVPLARALKSLVITELAKRVEGAGGRVSYSLTARGKKALKSALELTRI